MSSRHFRREPDGKLPVFVFPSTLNFYFEEQSTYKQVLTVYNPYDFTVQFKVFSNNPSKYNVVESEGIIKKACCIDIVIRVTDFPPNVYREDKFRVHLYEQNALKSDLIGTKEVSVFLHPKNNEHDKQSRGTNKSKRPSTKDVDEVFYRQRRDSVIVQRSLPSIPVIILSLCCIIMLMLPTDKDNEKNSIVPLYLHLTMNQKLIAAYVLGLVTMAVLKTWTRCMLYEYNFIYNWKQQTWTFERTLLIFTPMGLSLTFYPSFCFVFIKFITQNVYCLCQNILINFFCYFFGGCCHYIQGSRWKEFEKL